MTNLTVIIPAHIRTPQEVEWFKVALESIPPKTPTIVVNDHSPVPWQDVAAVVDLSKARIEQLPDDKHGLAACRNWAMKFVLTDFFFALDSDDYLLPDALSIAQTKYPGDGFLYGSTILFDERQRTTYQARPWDICKLIEAVYWPNGCLQQVTDWQKLGGWDESLPLYEDWDYWLRSAKAGIIGHHIPDVLYAYRQNPNGIIQTLKRNPDMAKRAREMIEIRHKSLFNGVDPMCSGCGGGRKAMIAKAQRNSVPQIPRAITIPPVTVNGLVLLTYTGGGLPRSFYGPVTGTLYRFGGSKRIYGYVASEDAPGMLKLRDGTRYLFTIDAPKVEEVQESAPAPIIAEAMPTPPVEPPTEPVQELVQEPVPALPTKRGRKKKNV